MEDDLKNGRLPKKWKTTLKMEDNLKMEDDLKKGRWPQKWKTTSKMEDDMFLRWVEQGVPDTVNLFSNNRSVYEQVYRGQHAVRHDAAGPGGHRQGLHAPALHRRQETDRYHRGRGV